MADVITLSDDDDIEILTPPPPVVLKPNSSVNHIGTVQGATAHISTVTKLNLDQLGLSRTSINVNKPKHRLNVAEPVMLAPIPITPQQRFHISARNGKRPSPSPAVPNSSTPSTSTQRTRSNQNTSAASQTYKGHYMFEATEGYEPSRRSTRFTKKIEGKFVCSYNPTTCYKLFGTAIALINHVWSHVAYDSPVGPPTEQESLEDALHFTLRKRPGVVLSNNSTLALERMRTCDFCNGNFISLHKKQQHVTKCHLEEEKEPTTCNNCEVDFETVPSYQVHAKNTFREMLHATVRSANTENLLVTISSSISLKNTALRRYYVRFVSIKKIFVHLRAAANTFLHVRLLNICEPILHADNFVVTCVPRRIRTSYC